MSPAGEHDPATGVLTWTMPITSSVPHTLTYSVRPLRLTSGPISAGARVSFADSIGLSGVQVLASPLVTITELCITATPLPSDTPEATSSPRPTSTPTWTPTPLPTPIPLALFLPVALSEIPCAYDQRADVVLVIDTSSSMNEPAGDGRTKLEAARSGAAAFIERLKLDEGDQAAIVEFNHAARIVVGLTEDPSALDAALRSIATASQTCLVCGLEAAGVVLDGDERRAENQPIVVLMTDGRSNPRPAGEAVVEAAGLKARGVVVFTIGLGAELDETALVDIASRPAFAFRAADGSALEAIYRELAVTLPGPADCYWGRRR